MVKMDVFSYDWLYYVVICMMSSPVNSSNDTTTEQITTNPNQIIISEKLFHILIGVSLLVILCCSCILLSCCISIWYHYKYKYKSIRETDIKREIELKQIQSNSHISSLQNNPSCEDNLLDIDSYDEIESTATGTVTKSIQSKNYLSPINRRTQSVPINTQQINNLHSDIILKLPLSVEGNNIHNNQLHAYINKQRKITSGGIILPKDSDDLKSDYKQKRLKTMNNKRFNSEELYVNDIKSSLNSRDMTPFGNTPNSLQTKGNIFEDKKDENDVNSCDSVSTLTLQTIENTPNTTKTIQLLKPKPNNSNNNSNITPNGAGEMNVVLEVYDNDISKENNMSESGYTMDGYNRRNSKSKQTVITENSEGYKMTNKQKLNNLKCMENINSDEIQQYEINHTHIPDIRAESDFDIQSDEECKSIHHDTVKKHKKKIKNKNNKYKKRRKYHNKYKSKYKENNQLNLPSPNNSENTSDDDDDVLIGLNENETPKGNNNNNKMEITGNNNNNSPFQPNQNNHYHTQPNLKYVNNNKNNDGIWLKPLQPPFIVDDKKNKAQRFVNK